MAGSRRGKWPRACCAANRRRASRFCSSKTGNPSLIRRPRRKPVWSFRRRCSAAARPSIENPPLEITQKLCEGRLELQLKGRFDANWTAHVGDAIESAIRAGQHRVDLDLDQVSYLSSAGLGLLVRYSRQLQHARGELRVVRTTDAVLSVLQLSGVAERLVAAPQLLPDHLPAAGTGESAC